MKGQILKNKIQIPLTYILVFSILLTSIEIFAQTGKAWQAKNARLNKLYEYFSKPPADSLVKARKYAEEALSISRETGNNFIQAKALIYLGGEAARELSTAKARKYFTDALMLSKSLNNEYLEAEASLKFSHFLGNNLTKPDSALIFAKKAYSTGISLNDSTLLKSSSFYISQLYRQMQDPINAIKMAQKSLEYNKFDNLAKANLYIALGIIYNDIGNPKEAIKYYELALIQSEANKNELQIASVLNNIAVGNAKLENWNMAVKNHLRALNIYKKYKEAFGTAYTYNLLGSTYSLWGKSDEAIDNYMKAVQLFLSIKNNRYIAFVYANLAGEYLKNNKDDLAFTNLKKALENGKISNDKLVLCDVHKAMAVYYRKKNKPDEAISYLKSAAGLAKEIKNPNFLQEIYNEFSLVYGDAGDSKNALSYLRLKNEIADTISKKNAQKSYIEMMVKYETMKTQEEMAETKKNLDSLERDARNKRIILWGIIGILTIAAFLSIFFYRKTISAFLKLYKILSKKPFNDNRNIKTGLKVNSNDKQEPQVIDLNTVNIISDKLKVLLVEEKKYLDSSLTLNGTARLLSTNTAYLSRIINEQSGMNFSNYINKYRIEEAKKLLNERRQNSLTLEGIGKNCGFVSRSAFNSAFKKFTGLTPTEYISQLEDNI